jgi:hypothetical protein
MIHEQWVAVLRGCKKLRRPLRGHKQASSSARYVLEKKETGITALAAAPVLAIAAGAPSLLWANRIG